MTPQRMEQLLQGQTNITRKVYEFVPIQEAWTSPQILNAMRQQQRILDTRSLDYCLEALAHSGLIRRNAKDQTFQRQPVTPARAKKSAPVPVPTAAGAPVHYQEATKELPVTATPAPAPAPAPEPADDAIEVLSIFGRRLRALSESVQTLADDLDAAALQLEEVHQQQLASGQEELTKLRALREMLRGL